MRPRSQPAGRARSKLRCCLAATWLLLPFTLLQPQRAAAQQTRFALACVGTETGYTINFSYRWGTTGQWIRTSVAPKKWALLIWKYDRPGQNHSPELTIRYDDDTTDNSNYVRSSLKAYAAKESNCEKEGKTYNFYERGQELYIQEED